MAFGSGTLVDTSDKLGLVVTNWHVVEGAQGEITVQFPGGFRSPARVLKVDRDWDLAALSIWRPPVRPVPLAPRAAKPGEILTIAGYGSGTYRAASGRCTQYVAPGLQFPYEMVEVLASARQGDSGGPILNSSGQLAGVLFGAGEGRTSGSYCGRVHRFLSSIVPPGAGGALPVDLPSAPVIAASPPPIAPLELADRQTTSEPPPRPVSARHPALAAATVAAAPPLEPRPEQPPPAQPQTADWRPAAAPSAAEVAGDDSLSWRSLTGETPLEQIKAALATVGASSLLLCGWRWLRSG